MKNARMNISHFRFILFNLKIFGEIVTTKKKKKVFGLKMLISQCHFDWPLPTHGPSAGLPEANEPHGSLKPMGHGVIVPPAPPLGGPALGSLSSTNSVCEDDMGL